MSVQSDLDILDLVHNLGALGRPCNGGSGTVWSDHGGGLKNKFYDPCTPTPLSIHNRIPQRSVKGVSSGGSVFPTTPQNNSKRIQPVSVPRKPPDLQNSALFPSIGESLADNGVPDRRQSFPPTANHNNNIRGPCEMSPQDRKLKKLENKFTINSSTGEDTANCFGTPNPQSPAPSKIKPRKYSSISTITVHKSPSSENAVIVKESSPRKIPRSAELFADLTPEIMEEVDELAQQYSSVLDNNICFHVLDEITLLLRLVASGSGGLANSKFNQKLSTLGQQVYFVIKVLSLQLISSLTSIDPTVIQILIQKYPHRIPKPVRKHFECWVNEQLRQKSESELAELAKSPPSLTSKPSEFHNCVTFRSETDGRSNFPCQGDFHAFCKQRDLFYTIKNSWNGRESGTSFTSLSTRESDPIYPKIKALFHLNSSWANLSHLAALFTSQFILDTVEDLQKKEQENNKLGNFKDEQMRSLIESNPDKFAKLRDRMSMSTTSESLKECLSFAKYFLGVASSPAFNQHLSDRLSYEITQIETYLENSVHVPSKEIISLLRKAVLFSQLLGYVTFLPYSAGVSSQSRNHTTVEKEALLFSQAQLRSHQHPPLDLESKLKTAISQRRLTFTIPWVIEFLLAADPVSLQLPSYKRVITLILTIYRSYLTTSAKNKFISLRNRNFLRFWCGKLLSSSQFVKTVDLGKPTKLFMRDSGSAFDEEFLDSCANIGEMLVEVYFAAEFQEMKSILHEGLEQQLEHQSVGKGFTSSPMEPKHIRPIPADKMKNPEQTKQVQLQCQLESSFFDSNPPSVKKTVDFIAERIASNYVKTLRGQVPKFRCDLAVEDKFETDAADECKNQMLFGLEEFCKSKCFDSVNVLIGECSISSAALIICREITYRHCCEKVSEWVENHIKPEMFPVIPSDDIAVLKKKQAEQSSPSVKQTLESSSDFQETFSTMILLHKQLKKLHQKVTLSGEEIDSLLFSKALEICCSHVSSTLVDFGISLIAFVPESMTLERQERLLFLWKKTWNSEYKIMCARNLLLIQDSCRSGSVQSNEIWKVLTRVVAHLVKNDMVSLEELEQDCLRLLRDDWDSSITSQVSALLREITTSAKSSSVNEEQSRETIDWIAWYCSSEPDDNF